MAAVVDITDHQQRSDGTLSEEIVAAPKAKEPASEAALDSERTSSPSPRLTLLCGYAQAQGSRPYQQDVFSVVDNGYLNVEAGSEPALHSPIFHEISDKKHAAFAIFDGHGSDNYAKHAADNIHDLILGDDAFKEGNFPLALANAFFAEDRELYETVHPEEARGGTTATVAMVVEGMLCEYFGQP